LRWESWGSWPVVARWFDYYSLDGQGNFQKESGGLKTMMNSQQKIAKQQFVKSLLFCMMIACAARSPRVASAAALIDVALRGSTNSQASYSSYTSSVNATPGQTVYYEVVVTLAAAGTTNVEGTNTYTIGATQSASDGLAGAEFVMTDSDSNAELFAPTLVNGFGTGLGAGTTLVGSPTVLVPAGTAIPSETMVVGFLQSGMVYIPMTAGVQVMTGTFTAGNVPESFSAILDQNVFGAKITTTTKDMTFGDPLGNSPYLQFSPLNITSVPEPASLGLLAMGCLALLARRRRLA
jgi:hypothetical protein